MDELAQSYSIAVGREHRRAYGQYFTPLDIAMFMCRWVLSNGSSALYDPGFGLGAFYFAAKSVKPNVTFRGADVDARILEHFRAHNSETPGLSLSHEDYLTHWSGTYDAIVCNPPYMRFQHFHNRHEIAAHFKSFLGIDLCGYTNIASAFLVKSLSELGPGGRLAYIMPLEFLNTGYGAMVKRRLLHRGMLKALIRLEPEKEVFPDAITSVGIVLVNNDGVVEPVRFYVARDIQNLSGLLSTPPVQQISAQDLKPAEKWLKYFEGGQTSFCSADLGPISLYGGFCRGIATGANEFFAMSQSRAVELGIPRSCFASCITKSAQVRTPVFTHADYEELERSDANVLLLNIVGQPTEAVRKYLLYGEEKGYHLRYLTKTRTPWYKLECRTPAPLLFGVFSRGKFKVIRNLSRAVNLTCYHCFYPNLFGRQFCDALFLYFQSRAARSILGISMRHYGNGLQKFEPNDLNRALAPTPDWFSRLSPVQIRDAVEFSRKNGSLPPSVEETFESLRRCCR